MPEYGTLVSDPINITSPIFDISIKIFYIEKNNFIVLYKYEDSLHSLDNKGWDFDFINPSQINSVISKAPYYRFKIIYKNKNRNSRWKDFRIIQHTVPN